jgi:mono/diheme cytochrome c family protein
MLEILEAAIPIAVATLLALASLRAVRHKTVLVKWGVGGIAALLSLVAAIVGVLAMLGLTGLHAHGAPSVSLDLARSDEQVRRGREIANGFCSGCHSPDDAIPSLIGGKDIGKHFPLPLGAFVPSNLTPEGPLARWSDGEVFRAIRWGVGADGRRLFVMSLTNVGKLSDDDTKAVIAYLRSARAEGHDTGTRPDRFSLLGLMMLGAHMLPGPKPVTQGVIAAPPKAPTAQFGEYILSYQDCRECHGSALTGGVPGQIAPLGPDLSMVKTWTLDQFVATLRTGVDPNGHELGKEMPWRPIGRMDDDELRAMYQYLAHLPAT